MTTSESADPAPGERYPHALTRQVAALRAGSLLHVVNYHVTPPERGAELERQLAGYLRHFDPVLPEHLDAWCRTGRWPLRRPGFAACFFDAHREHVLAAEVCESLGIAGWFLAPTGFIDCPVDQQADFCEVHDLWLPPSPHPDGRIALTWEELARIGRHHVLAGHTATHAVPGQATTDDDAQLLIALAVTAITVVVNLLAGYAFAKMPFRGRSVLFLLLLSTMMIPVQAIMVPQFDLIIDLGLYGSLWSVILPTSATVFGIFLARQFFLAIPDELLEAARVDGAGMLRTFLRIVLPLSRPLIAVLVLLTFMGAWNDFAWPLIALFSSQDLFTLPVGLVTDLKGQYGTNYGALMAMSLLLILPMVVLFVAFQRYFVAGLARSGIR
jgi:ABC-type glycerol-3-phosphate transport system permease component